MAYQARVTFSLDMNLNLHSDYFDSPIILTFRLFWQSDYFDIPIIFDILNIFDFPDYFRHVETQHIISTIEFSPAMTVFRIFPGNRWTACCT